MALKAGLVDHPPDDAEGRLYREISRSRIEPQGICVVNSLGKVLDWTFWFDDHKSVLAFLDHSLKRYAQFPDARKPVPAERYRKFPSVKLANVEDSGIVPPLVDRHPQGECCPAKPRLQQGTIVARVFGRALDKDGDWGTTTIRPRLLTWLGSFADAAAQTDVLPRLQALASSLHAVLRERWPSAVVPSYPALARPGEPLARVPRMWESSD